MQVNIYAWISVIGIIVFSVIPLFNKEARTKSTIFKAIWNIVVVLSMIFFVIVLDVPLFLAIIMMLIAIFIVNVKWSWKKGLTFTGIIIAIVGGAAYILLKEDPDYVVRHLEKYPDTSSFIFAKNGEELVSYSAEARMPLASTVKIIIAIEYAKQLAAGALNEEELVALEELDKFYLKDTDGGAHPAWLEEMKEEKRIKEEQVSLHDVAKGMIRYSSNANTDYLIALLGLESINETLKCLDLKGHEAIYPLVGSVLIPYKVEEETNEKMSNDALIETLTNMTIEEYRDISIDILKEIKAGEMDLTKIDYDKSLDLQRLWSDRLPGATARDYEQLLHTINENELFSEEENDYIRELLEWPMQIPGNEERFVHFGGKGGSTAFVLNQAMYTEDHDGNKYELILFTDNLSLWQGFQMGKNHNDFLRKMFDEPDYWKDVQERLE